MSINKITRDDIDNFKNALELSNFELGENALNEYQTIATKSAIYPGQGTPPGLIYVNAKLNGEAGEFSEHLGKAMRDDGFGTPEIDDQSSDIYGPCYAIAYPTQLTPERRAALLKELGDVLWYVSAACNELGVKLSEVATMNLEKLCDRSERDALRGSGDER